MLSQAGEAEPLWNRAPSMMDLLAVRPEHRVAEEEGFED
jgi:hypothetical protein